MSDNYVLPSLQLGTVFDQPIEAQEVPGNLGRGTQTALCILDGANRAPHRLSRLVRPAALLGVKLADPDQDVRVSIRLIADSFTSRMWDLHRRRTDGDRTPLSDDYVPPDLTGRHRLLEITAQGRSRGVVVLAPTRFATNVRQDVVFDVSAEEIDETGLLMVGVERPAHPPEWTLPGEIEDSAVGVCVGRMRLDLPDGAVQAHLSTGRPMDSRAQGRTGETPGFFTLNCGGAETVIELSPVPADDADRLRGRRQRVKHPVRAGRQSVDDWRTSHDQSPAHVEVVDLDGVVLLDQEVPVDRHGLHRVVVPAGASAVFVRARKVGRGLPHDTAWILRLADGDPR